ncbi:MAG TPA: hypothetical protein EYN91_20075 [Candidatus Melainabacteria bacterium]|jgi:ketosteroid isomerase-like protein|nr:hypothetical protein [Candidatus Melainabacteria bacterium]HIN65993.1 hypothetical protein [Candidatus Obscuribacterales bacterium]
MTKKQAARKNLLTPLMVSLALSASSGINSSVHAIETSPAATTAASSDSVIEPDNKKNEKERKEIEALLSNLETQWNAHDLDGVMNHYAEDYINNDGLDKKAVASITKKFWLQYPNSKSVSKIKQIRVDVNFATVESRDVATGTTEKENPDTGTKGDLNSVSEGQVYLKKNGLNWKIIGDRIDYEKVRVSYGLARQLTANFSAPEQVKSGRQYSARVDITLPVGLKALGLITSQPLKYPQPPEPEEKAKPRFFDGETLERVMSANTANRNELMMATIGITNSTGMHLLGLAVVTRRLNIIPQTVEDPNDKTEVATKADDDIAKKEDAKTDTEKSKAGNESDAGKAKPEESSTKEEGSDKADKPATDEEKDKKTETKIETKNESDSSSPSDKESSSKSKEKSPKGKKKKSGADSE